MDVSWTSIPTDKWNGDPIGLNVGYWISKRGAEYAADKTRMIIQLTWDSQFCRIRGLEVNMEVGFEVYGFTKVGNGIKSSQVYGSKSKFVKLHDIRS